MPAAFGTLIERLVGQTVFFAPDGSLIGTAGAAISATAKPATPTTAYVDYSLGRVSNAKPDGKTKDLTREWASATGGYKQRVDKKIIEDAFQFTTIDFAPQLYDQLMFGLSGLAVVGSQQLFAAANRFKDGWFYSPMINEAGVKFAIMEFHGRLSLANGLEVKNEYASPVWRIASLGDGGALDTLTSAVG